MLCNFIMATLESKYDLTLIGIASLGDGIRGITTGFASALYKDITMNNPWPTPYLNDMPKHLRDIFANNDGAAGNVLIYNDVLYLSPGKDYMELPNSKIKISYSMVEGSIVPSTWVQVLNSTFDAVIVPDDCLIEVYKNNGVNIPIFVSPICLPIENLLSLKPRSTPNQPFTFGTAGAFIHRKNQKVLLEAFAKNYGNNPNFLLKIHGRMFEDVDVTLKDLKEYIQKNKVTNVQITDHYLSRAEYIDYLQSLDCYVFPSRGEGFSITPHEALALGIPCILSNNTAHATICKTGLVKALDSDILGDVKLDDVRNALQEVYINYKHWKTLAIRAKKWVDKYTAKNLRVEYLNLVKPKKIVFGNKNKITKNGLETNSVALYRKYEDLIKTYVR